jgi:hypothetical protein
MSPSPTKEGERQAMNCVRCTKLLPSPPPLCIPPVLTIANSPLGTAAADPEHGNGPSPVPSPLLPHPNNRTGANLEKQDSEEVESQIQKSNLDPCLTPRSARGVKSDFLFPGVLAICRSEPLGTNPNIRNLLRHHLPPAP